MKTAINDRAQGLRQALAAVIVVFMLVLTGMAGPQVKSDLSASLTSDLSSVRQHAAFTPLY